MRGFNQIDFAVATGIFIMFFAFACMFFMDQNSNMNAAALASADMKAIDSLEGGLFGKGGEFTSIFIREGLTSYGNCVSNGADTIVADSDFNTYEGALPPGSYRAWSRTGGSFSGCEVSGSYEAWAIDGGKLDVEYEALFSGLGFGRGLGASLSLIGGDTFWEFGRTDCPSKSYPKILINDTEICGVIAVVHFCR